jgi:hypothetical protein
VRLKTHKEKKEKKAREKIKAYRENWKERRTHKRDRKRGV